MPKLFHNDANLGSLEPVGATIDGAIKSYEFVHRTINSVDDLYLILKRQGLEVMKVLSIDYIGPAEKGQSKWKVTYI